MDASEESTLASSQRKELKKRTKMNVKTVQSIFLTLPKEDSAFVYFTLESHEGLCFYSTTDQDLTAGTRTIHLQFSPEWETQIQHLINHLSLTIPIHISRTDLIPNSP
jgi:hypothetical protein